MNAREVISNRAPVGQSDARVTVAKLLHRRAHRPGVRRKSPDHPAVQQLPSRNSLQAIPHIPNEIRLGFRG
jgi:hypothetical protein